MEWKLEWKFEYKEKNLKLRNPVLIGGLPGIGNVGKVVVDFIIEKLKAKKLCDVSSYSFPPSVYINEKNIVELPSIEFHYKQTKGKQDFIFLAGDVQPIDETSSYSFTNSVLDLCEKYNVKEIITLGGIGLNQIPKKPVVFSASNNQQIAEKYAKTGLVNPNSYGAIGPIMGVSGLLVGMAKKRKIPAIALLAETYSHPMYLGIKGARQILKVLNMSLGIKVDLRDLDKEIKEIEQEMRKVKSLESAKKSPQDVNYIG